MIIAVELTFDLESTRRLTAVWAALAGIYGGPRITELGARPHVSLTVFHDTAPEGLCQELGELAQRFGPFGLHFGAAATFPTTEGVIYLAPDASARLQAVHAAFHTRLAAHDSPGHPYYRPGAWVPHCTVATDVPQAQVTAVLESPALAEAFGSVSVDAVHATAYRPARVLCSFPLVGSQVVEEMR